MISDERNQQLKTIYQLKKYSQKVDFDKLNIDDLPDENKSLFEKIINFFTGIPVPAYAAVLILCFGLILSWFLFFDDLSPLEKEYAKINKQKLSDTNSNNDITKLVLTGGKTRADGQSNSLKKTEITDKILIKIPLRSKSNDGETYKIEIIRDNEITFTLKEITPLPNNYNGELEFLLPSEIFDVGHYKIKIENNINSSNRIVYPLEIN